MENQEQVVLVFINLGALPLGQNIVQVQRVKWEVLGKVQRIGLGGPFDIVPGEPA